VVEDTQLKLERLEEELKKLEKQLLHMGTEYAQTRAGSAHGVEYYEIQVKVYQAMIIDVKQEILKLRRQLKGFK